MPIHPRRDSSKDNHFLAGWGDRALRGGHGGAQTPGEFERSSSSVDMEEEDERDYYNDFDMPLSAVPLNRGGCPESPV